MKTKTRDFHVYLPLDLAKKLEKMAEGERRSISNQIACIVAIYIEGYEFGNKLAEEAKRKRK